MHTRTEHEVTTKTRCVVCGGEIVERWIAEDERMIVLKKYWCSNCGLMYRFPPMPTGGK